VIGVYTGVREYDECGYLFAKLGRVSYAVALIFSTGLVFSAIMQPTALSSFFDPAVFSKPIIIMTSFFIIELVLITLYTSTWTPLNENKRAHFLLASLVCVFAAGTLLAWMLIHTYTLAPHLPEGLIAALMPDSLDWSGMLSLMVNRVWLPLTLKMFLVGSLTASLVLSAVAVLRYRNVTDGETGHRLRFQATWCFKTGLFFGAPIPIIGYWNAAIFHTVTPTIALGLMGSTAGGLSGALTTTVSPLWHFGVIGAMLMGAAAVAFYLDLDAMNSRPQYNRRRVIQLMVLLSLVLWALAVFGALDASISYPAQGVLAAYVLVGGYLISVTLWLYSKGQLRLRISILLFALACIGILLYIGPHTEWYLAAQYGRVPWPPVAFVVAVPVAFLLARKMQMGRYILIPIAALIAPLAVLAKVMDVAFLRGASIVSIDPAAQDAVNSWAYENYVNLEPLSKTYPSVTAEQGVLAITVVYLLFFILMFYAYRFSRPTHGSST
jgi:hypothetical protein